jgi:hypothetical protein
MILNHYNISITPDNIYNFLPPKEPNDFTFIGELLTVFKSHQIKAQNFQYDAKATAFYHLRANIDAGRPLIVLVKYQPWMSVTGNDYKWGHFVVVTGYNSTHVLMHDPLFGLWADRGKGAHFALPNDLFAAGWGGFRGNENPNWVCIIAGDGKETAVAPAPQPAAPTPIKPPPPPVAPPPPAAPPADPSAPTMADEDRRIRALAAYRWTEPPVSTAEMQLWRENLGDFGLTYENYTVQPGNTLVHLAARFYGEQHRWPAIKTYNELQRESLWVGQQLLIPHLGQSGAQNDPTLPSDTIDRAKALRLDDLVNPDLPAQDYNALGANSVGMGFMQDG